MYIRRTTYRLRSEFDTAEGQSEFEAEMRSHILPLEGLISTTHIKNEDGTYAVVAVWHSSAEANAALPKIRAEWERQSFKLAVKPKVEATGVYLPEAF